MKVKMKDLEYIVLGSYSQYAFSSQKKPLVWKKVNNKYVLSNLLEEKAFDSTARNNTFSQSDLNQWLTHDFKQQVSLSSDVTIPSIDEIKDDVIFQKTLRNTFIEGEFKGLWLKDDLNNHRVAYIDQNKKSSTIGIMADEKLSVLPMIELDLSKMEDIEIEDYAPFPTSGELLGKDYFYCNGKYIQVYLDENGYFVYIKNEKNEAVIVGHFLKGKELIFPSLINGLKVVGIIGQQTNPSIEKIIISEGIEYVGHEVLVDYPNLTHVELPASLQYFPGNNLVLCPRLEKIIVNENSPYYFVQENKMYEIEKVKSVKCVQAGKYLMECSDIDNIEITLKVENEKAEIQIDIGKMLEEILSVINNLTAEDRQGLSSILNKNPQLIVEKDFNNEKKEEKNIFCTTCGKQILATSKYCIFCGSKNNYKG